MMSDSEIDLIINVDSTVVSTPLTTSQLSTIIRKRKQTSDVWNYFSLSDERADVNLFLLTNRMVPLERLAYVVI
jgi:hypothetical protein